MTVSSTGDVMIHGLRSLGTIRALISACPTFPPPIPDSSKGHGLGMRPDGSAGRLEEARGGAVSITLAGEA
ncbi:hypothetical protein BG844_18875 [Couchioplanes caeruleus subsp. caeruleus]|uniref:Uncharacterized protein n=1 Tax=Couchioplanes caeruleus subsp. caeruleus TaxID=56427 RepID=A0A1K0FJ92_9ACTN|nr:hypothetical protein BG844_18875 [Couchioplanes caeruleus subsp. caeruleus]